jgi:DNA repair exonuclease SbcCD ATPase subunit
VRRRKSLDIPLAELSAPPSPAALKNRLEGLKAVRLTAQRERARLDQQLAEIDRLLELEPRVAKALETLSEQAFDQTLRQMEALLSDALRYVLGQDLRLIAQVSRDGRNVTHKIEFQMERDGKLEDVMRGQGGSVANVLSVAMRLFALRYLNPAEHRPFLILDEPDAWLAPDLVPKLMAYIADASKQLGIQVIVITHHDLSLVGEHADKVIEFVPGPHGVTIKGEVAPNPEALF